jgi:hypothetical protein
MRLRGTLRGDARGIIVRDPPQELSAMFEMEGGARPTFSNKTREEILGQGILSDPTLKSE